MKRVEIQYLLPDEIVKERRRNSIIYLPVGPLEWHGPHLPLGVDALRAHLAAVEIARRTGGVVLPTLFIGTERERSKKMLRNIGFKGDEYIVGMDFPSNCLPSLYFPEETFAIILRDYLHLIIEKWKFKNIIIVNGHGGENHLGVIERLIKEFTAKRKVKIIHVMPMLNFPKHRWSHATLEETETIMAFFPESVNLEKLPDGDIKNIEFGIVDDLTFKGKPQKNFSVREEEDPRKATQEKGRKDFERTISQLVRFIMKKLEE